MKIGSDNSVAEELDFFHADNHGMNVLVHVYMFRSTLKKWNQDFLKKPIQKDNDALTLQQIIKEFKRRYKHKIKKGIQNALKDLTKNRSFPSPVEMVSKLNVTIRIMDLVSASVESEKIHPLKINISPKLLEESNKKIKTTLKHELYHVISSFYEHDKELYDRINKIHKSLTYELVREQSEINKTTQELLDKIKKRKINEKNYSEYLQQIVNVFHDDMYKSYWNVIMDAGLCILAIERGDEEYISEMIKEDTRLSYLCFEKLTRNKKIRRQINDETLIRFTKLLEFIFAYATMPYNAIAYHVLAHSKVWKKDHPYYGLDKKSDSTKAHNRFREFIKKYTDKKVSESFTKFYDEFLECLEKMAIPHDPEDEEIVQYLHNDNSIKLAEKSLKTLNKEFMKFFDEFKQNKWPMRTDKDFSYYIK